jgi:hypothetical protein
MPLWGVTGPPCFARKGAAVYIETRILVDLLLLLIIVLVVLSIAGGAFVNPLVLLLLIVVLVLFLGPYRGRRGRV